MPTDYLALLHILSEPAILDDVRSELKAAGYAQTAASAKAAEEEDALAPLLELIPNKPPLLRSI